MATIHLNSSGSHFNRSRHNNCWLLKDDTDVGLSLISIILISNFVVGLPANVWVVWLICHIPKVVLSSEIYLPSLAVCEILNCLGLPAQLYCMYSFEKLNHDLSFLLSVLWMLGWVGRPIFQCSIFVECYFAVVHPLVFIRFKPLKYKVPQCALTWCVFILAIYLMWTLPTESHIGLIWFLPILCMLLFCYFSVLCTLKQRGPGETEGNERRRGDKLKGKAYNIILVHLASFLLNYFPIMVLSYLKKQIHIPGIATDLILYVGMLFGLVQPLVYLHNAGTLSCVREHGPEG